MQIDGKEVFLSVRLEGHEIINLETGKARSGIRANAEFIRFLIKNYATPDGGNERV